MATRLTDRVAIVTGAASGIGLAIASAFLREGARVALVDLDRAGLGRAINELDAGDAAMAVEADVALAADVERGVQETVDRFGGVDVLCNNAAIQVPARLDSLEERDWDRIQDVNLKSVFLTVRASIPAFRRAGRGVVINIASIDGLIGEAGVAPYCAAKGGMINLSRAMALDYARERIRVNCVAPGMTDTPMFRHFISLAPDPATALAGRLARIPTGQLVHPDEVAAAAVFLASDDSSGITGAVLSVDNGLGAGWDYVGAV